MTVTQQIFTIIDSSDTDESPLWAAYDRLYETATHEERVQLSQRVWEIFGKPSMPRDIVIGSDAAQDELIGMVAAVFLAGFAIGVEHCEQGLPTP